MSLRLPRHFRACLVAGALAVSVYAAQHQTALDRYVAAPDPNYKWEVVNTIPGDGYTTYVIDLTSQQYLTAAEVDHPIWKHWLTVVKPAIVKSDAGFLFITGGRIGVKAPLQPDTMLTSLALATGSVASMLQDVPNEPLTFAGETKARSEDAIIAYTWDKYLRTGDEKWPLRLPMTKSAVRAMDTVTAFCHSAAGGNVNVDKFVVAGGSKRGWTTWTTAAVDKRVVAITPLVIDLLNIEKSFEHHYRAYGFYAPAVHDYEEMHIMDWSGTKEYRALMQIEEPYSYRDRLTMPKYIVNDTGDQFFLPDSSQFYFDDLKGEKHLRYIPNTDHSLKGSDARESMQAFYEMVLSGTARPKYSWKFEKDGGIRVQTMTKPSEVKLWQATDPNARDFRLEKIGAVWTSAPLEEKDKGLYVAKVDKPEKGWTAYFVEMTYPGLGKYPMKITTGVRVTPDTLPFNMPPKPAHPPKAE
jgi:PhoPQ-activated pathogenicity-related protein